jgi:TetR/AcrR family transcriptional regulator, mexJK operon transcriptional repressor
MSKTAEAIPSHNGSDTNDESACRTNFLLDTAAEVFLEQGFEGASVGEIARRAKASKQTIYSRYPSKAELLQAVVQRRADLNYRRLSSLLIFEDSPRKALTGFGYGLLGIVLDPNAMGILRLVYMESCRFPELGKILYRCGPGPCLRLVESYLAQQTAAGRLEIPILTIAAEQFLDMLTGRLVMRSALGLSPTPSDEDKKLRVESAVDVFLKAYGAAAL